ncbi:hypothetical protein [Aeromonas dhakensis]|nr:hypothetical protein [Aeromonas dhakensis]
MMAERRLLPSAEFLCASRQFLHEAMAGKRFSEIMDKRLQLDVCL